MRKVVQSLFVLLLALIITGSFSSCNKSDEQTATVGKSKPVAAANSLSDAYNFKLVSLDGKSLTLSDFKGKVVILDFWDTWCPPCRKEIPHFVELYNQYNKDGLEILGVAFGREGVQAVNKFIQDYNIPYLNAIANEQIMNGFGPISSIPTTFVIDKNGKIFKKYIGYNAKSVFEADINALL